MSAKPLAATEETHSPAGGESEQAKTGTAFFPSNLFVSGSLPGKAACSGGGLSALSTSFQEILSQSRSEVCLVVGPKANQVDNQDEPVQKKMHTPAQSPLVQRKLAGKKKNATSTKAWRMSRSLPSKGGGQGIGLV